MRKNTAVKVRKTRLLIVDDHSILRAGLKLLFEEENDFIIVGEASTGKEAIAECGKIKPDILLLDITLPDMNGLEVARKIAKMNPEIKILVLTMHESEEYVREFLKIGAKGYVIKKAADRELVEAVRTVAGGNVYIHSAFSKIFQDNSQVSLSKREKQVLVLLAEGFVNKEIGAKLKLSTKTVETYRNRLLKKLGMTGRAQLTRYAIEKGYLNS